MFRTVPLSIIRSLALYTQQWYMSYRFADSLRAGIELYVFRTVPLSIIRSLALYTQQWCMWYWFADSLRAGSGRSVLILLAEFYSKNKLEKLVHLVGFIIRIYHDARSPECQSCQQCCVSAYLFGFCFIYFLKLLSLFMLRFCSCYDHVTVTNGW